MASTVVPPTTSGSTIMGAGGAGGAPSTVGTASGPGNSPGNPIETSHEDMIHDAQLDYYGKRLATCSSDRTVRVFDVVDGHAVGEGAVLRGHSGPVWQVAWAHPSFGGILASCSYDGRVFVWKEVKQGGAGGGLRSNAPEWEKIKEHMLHSASVNSISWAPHELGPVLACASSDGKVSVLTFNNDGSSTYEIFPAHSIGVNAVSWAPAIVPGSVTAPQVNGAASASGPQAVSQQQQAAGGIVHQKRFASAGCDTAVRIWSYKGADTKPELEDELAGHTDWVRDVAWAPNIGLPGEYIATASQDRTVLIHYRPDTASPWTSTPLLPNGPDSPPQFAEACWRCSWSLSGNVLAVSCGDGKITLWKETIGGKGWECVSEMTG